MSEEAKPPTFARAFTSLSLASGVSMGANLRARQTRRLVPGPGRCRDIQPAVADVEPVPDLGFARCVQRPRPARHGSDGRQGRSGASPPGLDLVDPAYGLFLPARGRRSARLTDHLELAARRSWRPCRSRRADAGQHSVRRVGASLSRLACGGAAGPATGPRPDRVRRGRSRGVRGAGTGARAPGIDPRLRDDPPALLPVSPPTASGRSSAAPTSAPGQASSAGRPSAAIWASVPAASR